MQHVHVMTGSKKSEKLTREKGGIIAGTKPLSRQNGVGLVHKRRRNRSFMLTEEEDARLLIDLVVIK